MNKQQQKRKEHAENAFNEFFKALDKQQQKKLIKKRNKKYFVDEDAINSLLRNK